MTTENARPPMSSFVKLLVSDVDASLAFYLALGFALEGRDSVFVRLRWAEHGHLILVKTPPVAALEGKRGLGMLLCFTASEPNVEKLAQRALERGLSVDGPRTTPWHTREVVLTDLDGYRLNFVEPA